MKRGNVHSATKVALWPVLFTTVTVLPVEKKKTAPVDNYEKFTKFTFGEFFEICAPLKVDLLKDLVDCVKFVDNVGKSGLPEFLCKTSFQL